MSGIGERLREERKRIGLKQKELAEFGGVQLNSQSLYENNARMPDAGYLAGIAKAGIDILYVVTGIRTPKGNDSLEEDEARLVKNYNQAGKEDKVAAQQLLSTLAKANKRAA